jgi:predicted nucleotidyltransferase
MIIEIQAASVNLEQALDRLASLCKEHYGKRLVSLAVFGSVGRGTARPDSDVDLLLVVEGLSSRRLERVDEFSVIEHAMRDSLKDNVELSPIFKTPEEIQQGSPLLLDMVEDVRVLFDRDNFLRNALTNLQARLESLGARRIWLGNVWYWDLKPDYKVGEVFEI